MTSAARAHRGELKVYVGMAAGVGKTYAMLQEGRERLRSGQDVVIGWLETHGRAETAAQAEGLEVVPALQVTHRGVVLRDMDTAAVIARRPEVALVDELAHTNAPGMPHPKRHHDVAGILDAGIDVISTMNVQHLESLNDRVFELTGVRVRETVPDRVLLEADEVSLVDLTPEILQARLRAGKVYPQERVDTALLNFFTAHNLSALREVALREVAGAVDEQIQRDVPPARDQAVHPKLLSERVMVLAEPVRGAQRLVRRAWRTARRLGGDLDVVALVPRRAGDDLAEVIALMARERGVTRLVMMAPRPGGVLTRLRRDLLGALLERLDGVDVMLVAAEPAPPAAAP
ncbi:MAG: histidine kinase [Thermoleophilia bacterium]|nr:histidine kinase [Thermoleophilia bacterium]